MIRLLVMVGALFAMPGWVYLVIGLSAVARYLWRVRPRVPGHPIDYLGFVAGLAIGGLLWPAVLYGWLRLWWLERQALRQLHR